MKRKIISLLALLLCISCLAACGDAAAPLSAARTEPLPLDDDYIHVSTVDELLANIGSDVKIMLEPGVYSLSSAGDYGQSRTDGAYTWAKTYDGCELIIRDVKNLTIAGTDAEKTVISAGSRYANVINFIACRGITLDSVTAGHTQAPGSCTGDVLRFERCADLLIDDCELYGCGVLGVNAYSCENVYVRDTDIYDCSQGAAFIRSCENICFDDCKVFDCSGTYNSIFDIDVSSEVAVINSEIYSNSAYAVIGASYSSGVYFGGNKVRGNELFGLVSAAAYPITVEGCSVADTDRLSAVDDIYSPFTNLGAVDADGKKLDDAAMRAMKHMDVIWSAKPRHSAPTAELSPDENGVYRVASVDELLSALGSSRTIHLEPGLYDLSTAQGYGSVSGAAYTWANNYDGPGLVIRGVHELIISADSPEDVTIVAAPRYADVFRFEQCDGVTVSGFTAGHTEYPGYCTGGVLSFDTCNNIAVDNCSLYGCGVLGINAYDCDGLSVSCTEIYDCTQGGMQLFMSSHISLDGCDIHDLGGPALMLSACRYVSFNGEAIYDGSYELIDGVLIDPSADRLPAPASINEAQVHEMILDGDWTALADNCFFPLSIGDSRRGKDSYMLAQTREDFLALDLDFLFDADFCDNVMEKLRAGDYAHCGIYLSEYMDGDIPRTAVCCIDPWIFNAP